MSKHNRKNCNSRNLSPAELDNQDNVISINRKRQRQNGANVQKETHLNLKRIEPLTYNQKTVFDLYDNNKNIVCAGSAGAGKSFILLYLMYNDLLNIKQYQKIKILRSVLAIRDIGFLPGTDKEKTRVYESPYIDMTSDLFGRSDAYELLKKKNMVEFVPTSFIRGSTWNDTLILVDEFENMNFHELDSIITRCGNNSRIFFAGDIEQTDLIFSMKDKSGFVPFLQILNKMQSFDIVEFDMHDCVRGGIPKEYLYAKHSITN